MSELRPQARELLDATRRERTPNSEQRARAIADLLALAAETATSPEEAPPLAKRLGAAAKLLLLSGLLLLIAGATYLARNWGTP